MAIIDKKGVLHGSVDNIVYRGYFEKQVVQMKPKKFKQTLASKESSLEFGLCSSTARVIRHAFGYTYGGGYDGRMINRMNSAVRNGVTASQKARGERDMHDADLGFLNGFQFNNNSPMPKVLLARPQSYLDAENKICIELPAITQKDIKGPRNGVNYILRFVAIAFDFKKKVFCYNSVKEIKIGWKESFEGGVIQLDDEVIKGRLVVLSMSIHAYGTDGFGGIQTFNSKAWSPSELIGAWHIEGESEADEEEKAKTYLRIAVAYAGNDILKEIARLREKAGAAAKKAQDKAIQLRPKIRPEADTGFVPPKGDIDFPKN